jgi:hypothetical protein
MAQQTAVEWLIKEIDSQYPNINILWKQRMIEQAKGMERMQIIEADLNATKRTAMGFSADVSEKRVKELGEQYYNETFGK